MYSQSSLSKSIALLLVLCFASTLIVPVLIPQQEVEACKLPTDDPFWVGVGANAAVEAFKGILKEVKKKWQHKSGIDPNSSHDDAGHEEVVVRNPSNVPEERYRCVVCNTTAASKAELPDGKHGKNERICEKNPKKGAKGCGDYVYNCTEKDHKQQHCKPCNKYYLICTEKQSHANCSSCNDVTCGYDDNTCSYDDNTCSYDDNTCGYDDSTYGY